MHYPHLKIVNSFTNFQKSDSKIDANFFNWLGVSRSASLLGCGKTFFGISKKWFPNLWQMGQQIH